MSANHLGHFQFGLCNVDGFQEDATQDCLDKTPLADANGNTKITFARTTGQFTFSIKLPEDVSCKHCVFQWKYSAANNWGTDPVTGQSGLGFGAQEQFRGCADITITSKTPSTVIPTSTTTRTISTTTPAVNLSATCPNGDGYCRFCWFLLIFLKENSDKLFVFILKMLTLRLVVGSSISVSTVENRGRLFGSVHVRVRCCLTWIIRAAICLSRSSA